MIYRKAYVIGTNVRTSLSPTIFQYWFKKYNIEGKYTYKEIEIDSFDNEIKKILNEEDLCGLNVTMPFKEKIIPHLKSIDSHSANIGAVNCVSKNKNFFEGTNTDRIGFINSINNPNPTHPSPNPDRKKKNIAIVVGYGGSAKAIVYSLVLEGFKKIKVFNRTFKKIEKINKKSNLEPYALKELLYHLKSADLIVNTAPVNTLSDFSRTELERSINKHTIVCDITYRNKDNGDKQRRFLDLWPAQNRISGITMLVNQAAPCFYRWFGVNPSIDQEIFNLLLNKAGKG